MDAAVAALIGAGIGAVVPASASYLSGRQHRQDARDARLFDHRRNAYSEFLASARGLLEAAQDWHWGDRGRIGSEPPEDALAPLADHLADISLYGSPEADAVAARVVETLAEFTYGAGSADDAQKVQSALDDFVARARKDLGVAK